MDDVAQCQLCKKNSLSVPPAASPATGTPLYSCPRCGTYELSELAYSVLYQPDIVSEDQRLYWSHQARTKWEFEGVPLHIRKEALDNTMEIVFYKDPITVSENLIFWLGVKQQSMSLIVMDWDVLFIETIIGARTIADVEYVGRQLIVKGWLVNHSGSLFPLPLQLSFEGWEKYKELQRGFTESNRVFMAMKFNEPDLELLFNNFYKPALAELGYDLYKLNEQPVAGSITNRMRVAIKEAKFILADLSYGNRGAYWEAGFGEGLGKEVIYSVNESTLDADHHFDVQGQQAVIWTADNMQKAADELLAIVKATFF